MEKGEVVCGVVIPDVGDTPFASASGMRCRASSAALKSRLVVPNAFVEPERAEHTIASLCWSKYVLNEKY